MRDYRLIGVVSHPTSIGKDLLIIIKRENTPLSWIRFLTGTADHPERALDVAPNWAKSRFFVLLSELKAIHGALAHIGWTACTN